MYSLQLVHLQTKLSVCANQSLVSLSALKRNGRKYSVIRGMAGGHPSIVWYSGWAAASSANPAVGARKAAAWLGATAAESRVCLCWCMYNLPDTKCSSFRWLCCISGCLRMFPPAYQHWTSAAVRGCEGRMRRKWCPVWALANTVSSRADVIYTLFKNRRCLMLYVLRKTSNKCYGAFGHITLVLY